MGDGQREWANLTNSELYKTVYVEKKLLWAKRILASDQNRAVAWPARVSHPARGEKSWGKPRGIREEAFNKSPGIYTV